MDLYHDMAEINEQIKPVQILNLVFKYLAKPSFYMSARQATKSNLPFFVTSYSTPIRHPTKN